ncbi:MAG TPA: hypothetical protein VFL83_23185 [Anaeromyxobacter sp.]|nr:hypothetical protein [Anaeromyxobacter sp.]
MRCAGLIVTALLAAPASPGEWERFVQEDGVSGYARAVPGSRVLELRSVAVVDAPIEVVGAVLRDVAGLKRPGSSCYEARVLEQPDRDHYTFYAAYDVPGPFHDRVAVVSVANRYDLDHGRVVADLRAVPAPKVALPRGAVLIRDFEAQFVVEYLSREKTGVVYTSRIDPAGNIPAFLANYAARDSVLENARVLRAAARKPEYVSAAASSPDAALAERIVGDRDAVRRIVGNRLRALIPDPALVARLLAEPAVIDSFVSGDGKVGAVLLLGWGSAESRREAIALLLRNLLEAHTADLAAIDRFVGSRPVLDRILSGPGGDDDVATFLASARPR